MFFLIYCIGEENGNCPFSSSRKPFRVANKKNQKIILFARLFVAPYIQYKGWYMLARRAKRNGMLRDSPFHDFIVGVFDGIETTSSYNRHCPRCLSRLVETDKGKKVQYYHRAVVLTLISCRI